MPGFSVTGDCAIVVKTAGKASTSVAEFVANSLTHGHTDVRIMLRSCGQISEGAQEKTGHRQAI